MSLIPTLTSIGRGGISLFMFVCLVNILWKHVQMYVCVCSSIFVDMTMGIENTRFGVATNHREIESVIGHLYLLGFIILNKICIKTKLQTRDGFEDLIMRGEGVRHPMTSVRR